MRQTVRYVPHRFAGIADQAAMAGEKFTVSLTSHGGTIQAIAGEQLRYGDILCTRPWRPWWAFWRKWQDRYYRVRL